MSSLIYATPASSRLLPVDCELLEAKLSRAEGTLNTDRINISLSD